MRLIPSPSGLRNAGANVLDRVANGHLADLRPWPRTLIEEGPQRFVGKVQVDGVEKLNKQRIISTLSSAEGQPFSEFNVAVDRDTILAQYFQNGFPRATFEWW